MNNDKRNKVLLLLAMPLLSVLTVNCQGISPKTAKNNEIHPAGDELEIAKLYYSSGEGKAAPPGYVFPPVTEIVVRGEVIQPTNVKERQSGDISLPGLRAK